jgi:hypothetical protein
MCMNSGSLLSKPRPPPSTQLGIRPPPVTVAGNRGLGSIGDPSSNPSLRGAKGFMSSANTTGIEPLVGLTNQVLGLALFVT